MAKGENGNRNGKFREFLEAIKRAEADVAGYSMSNEYREFQEAVKKEFFQFFQTVKRLRRTWQGRQ